MAREEAAGGDRGYRWDDDLDDSINKLPCKGEWKSLESKVRELDELSKSADSAPPPTRAQHEKLGLRPLRTREELMRDYDQFVRRREFVVRCKHEESHEEIKARVEQLMGDTMEKMLERGQARKDDDIRNSRVDPKSNLVYVVPPPEGFIPPDWWLDEKSGLSPREIRALKHRKGMVLKAIRDRPRLFELRMLPDVCVYDVLLQRAYTLFVAFGLKHLYDQFPRDCPCDSVAATRYLEYRFPEGTELADRKSLGLVFRKFSPAHFSSPPPL